MSALPISVWRNNTEPQFYNLSFPSTNVRDIKGGAAYFSSIGTAGSFNADTISSSMAYISSISTTSITLDGNTLDTGGGGFGATLLLNGVPIATTSNVSSIADWAYEPAISTVNCDNQDITNAKNIGAVNVTATNSVAGVIGTFTTLNSGSIVNSGSILANTLQTTGLINAASISTPSLKANLISTGTINVSTLLGANAAIGGISTNTISSGTILSGSIGANTGNYSTITVSTINAGSVVAPVDPNPTFTSVTAGTGNFTTLNASGSANLTGLNITGTAYINNNILSNVGGITNSNTTFNCIVDASTNTSVYPTINLQTKFGGGGIINITADQPSIFVGVPSQQVNVTAKGGVGYVTGIPVGGAINLVANAGTSNSITPTGVLANGAIKLTAYSFINGAYTVPGLILESAGSIAAYSGLTSPSVGVFGCSFYSALTCLSLTCGASPATTSFPGVVYLRGDNGTKVVNGFYADTINNNALSDLNIRSKTSPDSTNRNINIDSAFDLKLNTSNGGQVYINNTVLNPAGTFVSTATSQLNMNGFRLTDLNGRLNLSSSQIYLDAVGVNPYAVVTAGDPFSSLQNGQIILATKTNSASITVIDSAGVGYIQTQASRSTINTVPATWFSGDVSVSSLNGVAPGGGSGTVSSFTNLYATNASTTNLLVSSINGSAPGGGWVNTATSPLNMNGNGIGDNTGTLVISSINVPIVGTNNTSIGCDNGAGTYTVVNLTSSVIQINQIGGSGGYKQETIAGNRLATVGGTDTHTVTLSTINVCPETTFSGDVKVSSFTQTLIGNPILQPKIQYGYVSTSGASGTVTVTLPQRYTTQQSYIPFVQMLDSPAAQTFASSITRASFILGWQGGGGGSQLFGWNTMGT